jgi:GT2 family glycosyltransferase/glycosyltransferase involved in cell wall biosynthesis
MSELTAGEASAAPESKEAATIAAHLDGFEGHHLIGWAYSEASPRNCAISITDEKGRVIAEGEASRDRPDLAALGVGRTNFAFRIPLTDIGDASAIHIFADGVELRGSPLPVGAGSFDGRLHVREHFAEGWVHERLPAFSPPMIDIVGPTGEIVASAQSRRDESGADAGFSPARFRISLAPLFGSTDVQIKALANGVPFARASCSLRLVSTVDVVTPEQCVGWLFSPDAPSARFDLEVRRNGVLVATAPCDVVRHDVRATHRGSNTFGFDIKLPRPAASPTEPCEISLRFPGSRKELFGGPFIVGHRTGIVAAARRAAEVVHTGELSVVERSLMQRALADYIASVRKSKNWYVTPKFAHEPAASKRRLTIIIPVYRGLKTTRDCIRSVLKHRDAEADFVVLVNDCSPDEGMGEMLARFAHETNLLVLSNPSNLGFVKTVNRALSAVPEGDVVLLSSDTEVFAGAFEELHRVAHSSPEIGTVTPLSNNATIFSYPHASVKRSALADIPWRRLSQIAKQHNANVIIDVPSAHGFCMLIKRELLQRVGPFDEIFGRGYGEENDFCAKAADLGFRNVAAGSVLVYRRDSGSFAAEKADLLARNLALISDRYPEYLPTVMEFEREDRMRSARWALDSARLAAAHGRGQRFTPVITNWLEGGTVEAIRDIAEAGGPALGRQLMVRCRQDGFLELSCEEPLIRASFGPSEWQPLFQMLSAAQPALVQVHQVLGYGADFIRELANWIPAYPSVFYVHDHFAICPRVTMIDSTGAFCGTAPADVCDRCVALGGRHAASRLETAGTQVHRELMESLLLRVTHVIAPSANAAHFVEKVYPKVEVEVIEHPESKRQFPAAVREGSDDEILLLGAIGPHKGSERLLEMAQLARLRHPQLRFRVVGHTNIDKRLLALGNVEITGAYTPAQLPGLIKQSRGRLALFLHLWPETYSYALSEAVAHGFIPLVPDIGAPAQRVRETGFGMVFRFPFQTEEVLALIADICAGKRQPRENGASPASFRRSPAEVARLRSALGVTSPAEEMRAL